MMYALKGKMLSFLLQTIPPEVKGRLMKLVPFAASKTATYLRFSSINWPKTRAFAGEVEGIRINIKGMYPQGTVNQRDYEDVRTSIIAGLKRLKDPQTGKCVFKGVFKREEIFHGDGVEGFPDIVLKPEDKYYISPKFFRRRDKIPDGFLKKDSHWRKISGSHRQYGIFVMNGADCRRDVQLDPADIMDIFPTVLYQLGLPIPDDIDGKVVSEAFKPEFLEAHPIRFEKTQGYKQDEDEGVYTDEDTSKLIESLKGLGYME
jgi:predicted AlkP superfamily phosphohydrolase/phosphomutase